MIMIANGHFGMNIPVSGADNGKTFAVIIVNETYHEKEMSNVEFAANDGAMFREYCIKTPGIPASNVHYKTNATLNNIRSGINWLTQVAKSYSGEANFIFYYAGHGIQNGILSACGRLRLGRQERIQP
jgi:hypothetical protein